MKQILYTFALILLQQIIESYGNARVSITGTKDDSFSIQHSGDQRSIISFKDAKKWNLFPEFSCQIAVEKYFGQRPNNCYLHEPTPWTLYPSYGWQEVTSIYKPINSNYVDKTNNSVELIKRSYINNQDNPFSVILNLEKMVKDTVTHRKSRGNEFGESGSANFSVSVMEANIAMDYKHTWGEDQIVEKTKTISFTNKMTVHIPPHTNLTFIMVAHNVKATFEVVCSNSLEGYVAVNYNPLYQGHHFWALSTRELEPTKKPKQITETITVDFYSDGFLKAIRMDLKNKTDVSVDVPLSDVLSPLVLHEN